MTVYLSCLSYDSYQIFDAENNNNNNGKLCSDLFSENVFE